MGSKNVIQKQAACFYRQPWKFSDSEIRTLVKCTKTQFFKFVLTCVGAIERKSG